MGWGSWYSLAPLRRAADNLAQLRAALPHLRQLAADRDDQGPLMRPRRSRDELDSAQPHLMPLSYRIDTVRGIVTIRGDYAEPAEWRVLLTAVAQDEQYRPGFSFIRDLRGSANPVSPQSVMGIMAVVREFWPQLRVRKAAIVTGRTIDDPAHIAEALAQDQHLPLRAFTTYEEAVEWLRED